MSHQTIDIYTEPFVIIENGKIVVGDCDNREEFTTKSEALAYCQQYRLLRSGSAMKRARRAALNRDGSNEAAEFVWHLAAGVQIRLINALDFPA